MLFLDQIRFERIICAELLDGQLDAELTHNDAWFASFSGLK